jgi:hypothetical protein
MGNRFACSGWAAAPHPLHPIQNPLPIAAWAEGQVASMEQAIAQALQ